MLNNLFPSSDILLLVLHLMLAGDVVVVTSFAVSVSLRLHVLIFQSYLMLFFYSYSASLIFPFLYLYFTCLFYNSQSLNCVVSIGRTMCWLCSWFCHCLSAIGLSAEAELSVSLSPPFAADSHLMIIAINLDMSVTTDQYFQPNILTSLFCLLTLWELNFVYQSYLPFPSHLPYKADLPGCYHLNHITCQDLLVSTVLCITSWFLTSIHFSDSDLLNMHIVFKYNKSKWNNYMHGSLHHVKWHFTYSLFCKIY